MKWKWEDYFPLIWLILFICEVKKLAVEINNKLSNKKKENILRLHLLNFFVQHPKTWKTIFLNFHILSLLIYFPQEFISQSKKIFLFAFLVLKSANTSVPDSQYVTWLKHKRLLFCNNNWFLSFPSVFQINQIVGVE